RRWRRDSFPPRARTVGRGWSREPWGGLSRGIPPRAPCPSPSIRDRKDLSMNQQRHTRLSGLEPLVITPELLFVNVGERTNVTGSAKFRKLVKEDRYDEAVEV